MKEILISIVKLLVFSAFIVGLIYVVPSFTEDKVLHGSVYAIFIFLFVLNLLTHTVSLWAAGNSKEKFAGFYFTAMVVRFFFSLMFAFVYLYRGTEDKILFVANFFVIYLLYICFDIYGLVSNLRPHSK